MAAQWPHLAVFVVDAKLEPLPLPHLEHGRVLEPGAAAQKVRSYNCMFGELKGACADFVGNGFFLSPLPEPGRVGRIRQ